MKGLPVFKLLSTFLAVALLAPLSARGEDAPAPPPKWYDTFEIHGLVDTYYSATFGQAQSDANLLRTFDGANGFQLSYTKLTAQLAPTTAYTAGFRADLGFGPAAKVLSLGKDGGTGPVTDVNGNEIGTATVSGGDGVTTFYVQQAYVSLKLPADIVLDAGKFVTNTGAEVIEAKDNWLYSRSILFGFAIPFTHTGVRATIPVPGVEGVSVMAAVFNGFDNPPSTVGSKKMGHLALMYSGPSSTLVVLNALYGYAAPGDADERLLLDGVVARAFGDLTLNVNADYNKLGEASNWGIAGMARYSFLGDKFRVSARAEYLDDTDGGMAGIGTKVYEGTLCASIPVGSNAEVRLEGRRDFSDDPIFKGGANKDQTTVQVAALAWF